MDQFEGALREMRSMPAEGLKKMIEKTRTKCICGSCPTYTGCMRDHQELLFCIIGKSPTCAADKKGCICPTCPVTGLMGLKKAYYCTKGSEKEQRNI